MTLAEPTTIGWSTKVPSVQPISDAPPVTVKVPWNGNVLKSIAVTMVTAPKGDEAMAGIAARPNTRNDEAASPAASLNAVCAISYLPFNQTCRHEEALNTHP